MNISVTIQSVAARVYRYPLETPVQTSFGIMRDRPMLLVSVTSDSGVTGWGEVWCNFPAVGAEHRARLVDSVLAPQLVGQTFETPLAAFEHMSTATAVLAIQSAEPGPFAQSIAGLDTAIWDLAGRMTGLPVWRMLGGDDPEIGVYASGLNPTSPEVLAQQNYAKGFRAFKLKIGFGADRDIKNLTALRRVLAPDARLMVDANQGWSLEQAKEMMALLEPFAPDWLEEPLRADRPWSEWHELQACTGITLAAGENVMGDEAFDIALSQAPLGVVQPDLAKWGGLSKGLPLARNILGSGRRYCPHYLGGGIGLLASGHLLAAVGGDGMLEIDSNSNPLRSLLCGPLEEIDNGRATLSDEPGLGAEPDLRVLQPFLVGH